MADVITAFASQPTPISKVLSLHDLKRLHDSLDDITVSLHDLQPVQPSAPEGRRSGFASSNFASF